MAEEFCELPTDYKIALPEIRKSIKEQEKSTTRAGYAAGGTALAVLGVVGLVVRTICLDK